MVTELKNATIIGLQMETINMKNGEQRGLLKVTATINGSNGVECHGCEVWGQDSITRLNLQQGKVYNISCVLAGRQWGGRFQYSLQAYKAEEVQQSNNEGGSDPFKQ